ncbi:MAG: periplasmic component of efflux system [Nitrospirae bacterium]|nr:periplasmic component of efflux system [Nitrospirota bacterium]
MNKRFLVVAAVVLIIVAISLVQYLRHERDDGTLLLSGTVEVTEVNLGFKAAGRLSALVVDEGQRVMKGDRLAELDSAEMKNIVAQNRAAVEVVEAEQERSRKDYERAVALVEKEVIPPQQLDAAKKSYDATIAQLRQTRAALAASQDRLRDMVITAPVSGVVLRKNSEAGETVAAGAAVYSLGDLENPWIRVYVKEDKLGLVKLGQKAEVMTDSFPNKTYLGIVTMISSEAEFTPKNVQTQEERVKLVFALKVSVKNENGELKPGMPADVKIILR